MYSQGVFFRKKPFQKLRTNKTPFTAFKPGFKVRISQKLIDEKREKQGKDEFHEKLIVETYENQENLINSQEKLNTTWKFLKKIEEG